jgi:hypothetical protein
MMTLSWHIYNWPLHCQQSNWSHHDWQILGLCSYYPLVGYKPIMDDELEWMKEVVLAHFKELSQ